MAGRQACQPGDGSKLERGGHARGGAPHVCVGDQRNVDSVELDRPAAHIYVLQDAAAGPLRRMESDATR